MRLLPAGAPRLGLGLAALGRPGYITLNRGADIADRRVEAMRARAEEVLDAAYAGGVRWFDCARSYGLSEDFVGKGLEKRGHSNDAVAVSSKWGYRYTAGWRVDTGGEPHEVKDHLRRTCGSSGPRATISLGRIRRPTRCIQRPLTVASWRARRRMKRSRSSSATRAGRSGCRCRRRPRATPSTRPSKSRSTASALRRRPGDVQHLRAGAPTVVDGRACARLHYHRQGGDGERPSAIQRCRPPLKHAGNSGLLAGRAGVGGAGAPSSRTRPSGAVTAGQVASNLGSNFRRQL